MGGDHLRRTREWANISQTQLAEHLGITQSYISQVERGTKQVSSTQLTRLYQGINTIQKGGVHE